MAEMFLFTRGVVFGILLLLCLRLWLEHRQLLAGRLLLALFLGVSCYTVLPFLQTSPWLVHLVVIPAILVPALFWLFSLALFQDWDDKNRKIGTARLATLLVYFIIAYAGYWLEHAEPGGSESVVPLSLVVFWRLPRHARYMVPICEKLFPVILIQRQVWMHFYTFSFRVLLCIHS